MSLPPTYRELCSLLMPRKILDNAKLEAAQEIVDVLAVLPSRTKDPADYLETLVEFGGGVRRTIRQDLQTFRTGYPQVLLEENSLGVSDLSRLLETDISLGYRILSGERGLTAKHIKKLAEHFRVGPEVLL